LSHRLPSSSQSTHGSCCSTVLPTTLKTKFHHAILVADMSEAGRRLQQAEIWPITSSELARASRSATGLRSASDLSATRIAQWNMASNLFATRFQYVRAISTCQDRSNLLEPGRRPVCSWSKPNSITLSWSQTGPRLVADMSQTC